MTRVLISGGAGFLGSHLSKRYLDKGHHVTCIDDLSTGRHLNIAELEGDSKFTFVEHDICKPLPEAVLNEKYDTILNLASPASPPKYQELAVETVMVGSVGTKRMLDLSERDGARFFHASTSEVYGDPEVHPQPESYRGNVNSYGPRAMYDEAKRLSEALIWVYRNQHGVNTCIGRFFNTYGPNMDPEDGRVVSNFIIQALKGEPITIYGDGSQTRSFCYVDDLVDGIVALIDSGVEGPMNLGNPGEFTVKQLAEKVISMIDTDSEIVYKPLPKDDPLQRKPDITYAKKALGWEPKIPLDVGLKPTIEYFKAQIATEARV